MANVFFWKITGLVLIYSAKSLATAEPPHEYPLQNLTAEATFHISSGNLLDEFDPDAGQSSIISWIWPFCTQEGMRIKVQFERFNMRRLYTVLEFGEGLVVDDINYGTSHTKIAAFSDTTIPDNIVSLSNRLWIRLRVHSRKAFDFLLSVRPFNPTASGERDLNVSLKGYTNISSPGYPTANYPNNAYRLWTVHAPENRFISVVVVDFVLENPSELADIVYIGDTTAKFLNHANAGQPSYWAQWRGTKPQNDFLGLFRYCSGSSSIFVLFTTNWKDTGKGFSLQLTAVRSCSPDIEDPTTPTEARTTASPTTTTYEFTTTFSTANATTAALSEAARAGNLLRTTVKDNDDLSKPEFEASVKKNSKELLIWKTSVFACIGFIVLCLVLISSCFVKHRQTPVKIDQKGVKSFEVVAKESVDDEDGNYLAPDNDPSPYGPITYVTRVKSTNRSNHYYSVPDTFAPTATEPEVKMNFNPLGGGGYINMNARMTPAQKWI